MIAALSARQILIEPTFEAWREQARLLLQNEISPEDVALSDATAKTMASLFSPGEVVPLKSVDKAISVPKEFLHRAEIVACNRDPGRWNLLYRVLWRLQRNRLLLHDILDDDIAALLRMEKHVRHDLHKMHAFVRFRKVVNAEGEHYVAWHQPDHFIVGLAAPFFEERFGSMLWSILTPDECVHWNTSARQLTFTAGVSRDQAPTGDELETLWQTYYRSIFNPARLNPTAMRSEMPTRYWKNLPELATLPQLMGQAEGRVQKMIAEHTNTAAPFVPSKHTLPVLRDAIHQCHGCDLYKHATQAVFGAGPAHPSMMFVGEQPGDEEDRRGLPFIGPAGRLLDAILEEIGINRSKVYVTNAVKHFKFVERGKRRIHESPRLSEMTACKPWLQAEFDAVKPKVIVCLGATASKSVMGAKFALMKERGKILRSEYADQVIATLHPSAILRAPDPDRAAEMRQMLRSDLLLAAGLINS